MHNTLAHMRENRLCKRKGRVGAAYEERERGCLCTCYTWNKVL